MQRICFCSNSINALHEIPIESFRHFIPAKLIADVVVGTVVAVSHGISWSFRPRHRRHHHRRHRHLSSPSSPSSQRSTLRQNKCLICCTASLPVSFLSVGGKVPLLLQTRILYHSSTGQAQLKLKEEESNRWQREAHRCQCTDRVDGFHEHLARVFDGTRSGAVFLGIVHMHVML